MINQKTNDTQVLIGQPINYPDEFVSLMNNILDHVRCVRKAYLACIQYTDPQLSPKILIGLDVSGDIEVIVLDIVMHIQKYDVEQIEFTDAANEQFKNYFLKIKPFYNRED